MRTYVLTIIGNRLTAFAKNQHIMTYDGFCYLLTVESQLFNSKNRYLVRMGQGLSDDQLISIQDKINRLDLSHRVVISLIVDNLNRASDKLSHKRHVKNTMISTPTKLADSSYKSYLMLDENCAEMSDHITGQHIQGMVLLEAARQMVNAVSEEYLIAKNTSSSKGFVLNKLCSSFHSYVFPLEVELHLSLSKIRHGLNGDFNAVASIVIQQQQQMKMTIDLDFSVLDKASLSLIEDSMALAALNEDMQHGRLATVKKTQAA